MRHSIVLTSPERLARYPLAQEYPPHWVCENAMGPNPLWLVEWLVERMDLKPGMRVLDLGCGRALTSIFLAERFGVQVCAADLWIDPKDNWARVRNTGQQQRVFPLRADANDPPYAPGSFDALVSLDAYHCFGTAAGYPAQAARYVRPGGQLGVVVPGFLKDIDYEAPPAHLAAWRAQWPEPEEFRVIRSLSWWRANWNDSEAVALAGADAQPDGWRYWLDFLHAAAGHNHYPDDGAAAALAADQGEYLGFIRLVGRRP